MVETADFTDLNGKEAILIQVGEDHGGQCTFIFFQFRRYLSKDIGRQVEVLGGKRFFRAVGIK